MLRIVMLVLALASACKPFGAKKAQQLAQKISQSACMPSLSEDQKKEIQEAFRLTGERQNIDPNLLTIDKLSLETDDPSSGREELCAKLHPREKEAELDYLEVQICVLDPKSKKCQSTSDWYRSPIQRRTTDQKICVELAPSHHGDETWIVTARACAENMGLNDKAQSCLQKNNSDHSCQCGPQLQKISLRSQSTLQVKADVMASNRKRHMLYSTLLEMLSELRQHATDYLASSKNSSSKSMLLKAAHSYAKGYGDHNTAALFLSSWDEMRDLAHQMHSSLEDKRQELGLTEKPECKISKKDQGLALAGESRAPPPSRQEIGTKVQEDSSDYVPGFDESDTLESQGPTIRDRAEQLELFGVPFVVLGALFLGYEFLVRLPTDARFKVPNTWPIFGMRGWADAKEEYNKALTVLKESSSTGEFNIRKANLLEKLENLNKAYTSQGWLFRSAGRGNLAPGEKGFGRKEMIDNLEFGAWEPKKAVDNLMVKSRFQYENPTHGTNHGKLANLGRWRWFSSIIFGAIPIMIGTSMIQASQRLMPNSDSPSSESVLALADLTSEERFRFHLQRLSTQLAKIIHKIQALR